MLLSPLPLLTISMSMSCLAPVQYTIRWHDRKKNTRRPANTENVTTMPRGGLPEVLNNAVQTMTVNTTNRNGIHLYVTSRTTLRDRMTLPRWNIWTDTSKGLDRMWLVGYRGPLLGLLLEAAFPSRIYLSPEGSSTTCFFLPFRCQGERACQMDIGKALVVCFAQGSLKPLCCGDKTNDLGGNKTARLRPQ